jgi:phosphate/sulfate permease
MLLGGDEKEGLKAMTVIVLAWAISLPVTIAIAGALFYVLNGPPR